MVVPPARVACRPSAAVVKSNGSSTSRVTSRIVSRPRASYLPVALGGEGGRLEMRLRPAIGGEEVAARECGVAIAVLRIGRTRVDLDHESAAGEVVGIELDLRREAGEPALELGAGLHGAEDELTRRRIRAPGRGRLRDSGHEQQQHDPGERQHAPQDVVLAQEVVIERGAHDGRSQPSRASAPATRGFPRRARASPRSVPPGPATERGRKS